MSDDSFLVAFYENALGFAENNLSREDLLMRAPFRESRFAAQRRPEETLRQNALSYSSF